MAGANLERTSWTYEEITGSLDPLWFKPFDAYIPPKAQIITANDTLYVSTSKGLYALNASTGSERWIYATELPLGHSPTISNGIAYVGGYDHKLHAIDALTGVGLWTFEANAGFETNPLIVDGIVYLGNRDGYFYAIDAEGQNQGTLVWRYLTGGPVNYSAAYKDGVVFFASNDNHAYALNAQTGALIWKSAKLPGSGFQSWWPVIYRDRVIFSAGYNYRGMEPGTTSSLTTMEKEEVYPNYATDPRGTLIGPRGNEPGDWVAGTVTVDASRAMEYFASEPWRKRYIVLDRFTGVERETAPVLWTGTHSGNRYPPVIGIDGVLYQQNSYLSDPFINGGHISGWKIGTPYISIISADWAAVDEPHAYSAGGNLIYWNLCCDRQAGAFDITQPATNYPGNDGSREWFYYNYNLDNVMPGFNVNSFNPRWAMVYESEDGVYGFHGDQNPPVPYNGRIYMHRSNAVLAFGETSDEPVGLPAAPIIEVQNANLSTPSQAELENMLAEEIQKMVDAGHLLPGYHAAGMFDSRGRTCGDDLPDYFHHPGDTLYTLLLALPHLPAELQTSTRAYLQAEYAAYPPYRYNHIGWNSGVSRDWFDYPPEFEADRVNYPPELRVNTFDGWHFAPHFFYPLWKYAVEFGSAKTIFDASKAALQLPPTDDILTQRPHVLNAFITGYIGYLELEKLAGYPETAAVRSELNRFLDLRRTSFSSVTQYGVSDYCRALTVAQNFMYLVPELADYMAANLGTEVGLALDFYDRIAPYWFVPRNTMGFGETVVQQLYDHHSIYLAKALIQNEPREELFKYLDMPTFAVGDLFYLQMLVLAIEAGGG